MPPSLVSLMSASFEGTFFLGGGLFVPPLDVIDVGAEMMQQPIPKLYNKSLQIFNQHKILAFYIDFICIVESVMHSSSWLKKETAGGPKMKKKICYGENCFQCMHTFIEHKYR